MHLQQLSCLSYCSEIVQKSWCDLGQLGQHSNALAMPSHIATLSRSGKFWACIVLVASRTGIALMVPLLPKASDRSKRGSKG